MIDHIGFPVSDYERAKAFYLKALVPLGYSLVMEVTQEQQPGDPRAAGFGANGKPDLDRRRRRIEQADACRDPCEGSINRRCVLSRSAGSRRA